MTDFHNQQTIWIHFFDQVDGTEGGDQLTLDSSADSSDPTGATVLDGDGGDDIIQINGFVEVNWSSVTVDGGDGLADTVNINAAHLGEMTLVVGASYAIGAVTINNVERLFLTTGSGDDNLTGSENSEGFSAGDGLNVLHGMGGADTLSGGDDHDELFGGDGGDGLYGGGGDDTLFGGKGINYAIDGGAGIDTLDYSALGEFLVVPVVVNLTSGTAELTPDHRDESIVNVEIIGGTSFNDTLVGNLAANTFHGLGGDDLIVGSPGDPGDPADLGDTLYGDIGDDTIYGKYGDDTLEGGDDDDQLFGGGGTDDIKGGAGKDSITGGLGADDLDGGTGQDTLDYSTNASFEIKIDLVLGQQFSKNGEDWVFSGETMVNFETVKGGDANEEIIADNGDNVLGNGGNDTLRAAGNNTSLGGGDGEDQLFAGDEAETFLMFGGNGADTFYGGNGIAGIITCGGGGDTVEGGNASEEIYGGTSGLVGEEADGDDTLSGGGGDDDIVGAEGSDTLKGGDGFDIILAGDPNEGVVDDIRDNQFPKIKAYNQSNSDTAANTVDGGDGDDWLLGAKGADTIEGGKGNDWIYGGDGDDTLDGGQGKDKISAGKGDDTIIVAPLTQGDQFDGDFGGLLGFEGFDTLDLSAIGVDLIYNAVSAELKTSGNTATATGFEKVLGGSANDDLVGDDSDETFLGNSGNDTLEGGDGKDTLDGGAGTDAASYEGASAGVTVDLSVTAFQNTGGAGDDKLKSIENLTGSSFVDVLTGDGGANSLDGGSGGDTLKGGNGADLLSGGAGKDTIEGGGGADTFNYRKLSDSTGPVYDTLKGADFNADKWDIQGAVTGIDTAITVGQLRSGNFDADMAAAVTAAKLGVNHAVPFTPNSGNLAGKTFLIVEKNGAAGYQAGGDIVIQLQSPVGIGSLDTTDFI
jgi:Ca2+-binding RTX toxin-like protein